MDSNNDKKVPGTAEANETVAAEESIAESFAETAKQAKRYRIVRKKTVGQTPVKSDDIPDEQDGGPVSDENNAEPVVAAPADDTPESAVEQNIETSDADGNQNVEPDVSANYDTIASETIEQVQPENVEQAEAEAVEQAETEAVEQGDAKTSEQGDAKTSEQDEAETVEQAEAEAVEQAETDIQVVQEPAEHSNDEHEEDTTDSIVESSDSDISDKSAEEQKTEENQTDKDVFFEAEAAPGAGEPDKAKKPVKSYTMIFDLLKNLKTKPGTENTETDFDKKNDTTVDSAQDIETQSTDMPTSTEPAPEREDKADFIQNISKTLTEKAQFEQEAALKNQEYVQKVSDALATKAQSEDMPAQTPAAKSEGHLTGFVPPYQYQVPVAPAPPAHTSPPNTTPAPPSSNAPQSNAPQPYALQPNVPPPYAPQSYSPQSYSPQPYAPQPYAPQPYAPQPYAPQTYAPQPNAPQPNAPQPNAPQPYAPQPYAPQPYTPQPYAPRPYAPQPKAPKSKAPKSYAPQPYKPPHYNDQHQTPSRRNEKSIVYTVFVIFLVVMALVTAITYILSPPNNSNNLPDDLAQPGTEESAVLEVFRWEEDGVLHLSIGETVLVVVNRDNQLPADYGDGVDPDAKAAYDSMLQAAASDGVYIYTAADYLDYKSQGLRYNRYANYHGEEIVDRFMQKAGYSENQLGVAFHVNCAEADYMYSEAFAQTPEYQWLIKNAADYGFILRYPEGKESITGYSFSPWHFRYVGEGLAKLISESGMVIEEYLDISEPLPEQV